MAESIVKAILDYLDLHRDESVTIRVISSRYHSLTGLLRELQPYIFEYDRRAIYHQQTRVLSLSNGSSIVFHLASGDNDHLRGLRCDKIFYIDLYVEGSNDPMTRGGWHVLDMLKFNHGLLTR